MISKCLCVLLDVEHGVSFLFAAIVARADDNDDDHGGKDDRYIKLSALFCTLS